MKRFLYFRQYSTFDNIKAQIPEESIVFIEDANCIYTHGQHFYCNNSKLSDELVKYCTKEEYNTLVNKLWNGGDLSEGFFETKNVLADGSYAKLWNENSGGGSQFFNVANNHLNFVGVNNGNDGIDVQIYAKDKTSNLGVRINVNTEKAYYGKGAASDVNKPENEIATVGTVNQAIADVVNGAPETFDTLKEISDYISDNENVIGGLVETIASKASKEELEEGLDTKQDKGNYLTYNPDKNNPERKVITLNNTDLINSRSNNEELENKVEVNGRAISLIQLNAWNVVDIGSPYTLTNINVPNGVRPTVQEASQSGLTANKIAYLSDIEGNAELIATLENRVLGNETKLAELDWEEFD